MASYAMWEVIPGKEAHMGQFGSKGGLRRIVPVKSDRNRPKAALVRLQTRLLVTSSQKIPTQKSA